jgi:4-nitrophenyl phosphatase
VRPKAVALDLDGVLWRATEPIPGSVEAVAALQEAGADVVYVTNNAGPTVTELEAKLHDFGVDAGGRVLSSPMAAAGLLRAGDRVLVAGGPGVTEAVAGAGAHPFSYDEVDAGAPVDVVLVGYHRDFDWQRMRIASTAVRDGARFIATNDDATYPDADGLVPGNGALVAAIATASGVDPVIAGKPHAPMAALVLERCGAEGVFVGDRADTDGALAHAIGWRFALVLSGVTTEADLPVDPIPDVVAPDLAALVRDLVR